jgi:hypothetical protein
MGGREVNEHLCGAIVDKTATDNVCLAIASSGAEPFFADAKPGLRGFGEGKSVLLQEAELKLFGKYLPSWNQARGTCVGQGTGRALQDATFWAIAFGDSIGKPTQLCFETIYAGSRIQIGKGWLGNQDGASGAQAAQYVREYGLLARGVYGSIDLSKPREDLAVTWGAPRHGVPTALLSESATFKAEAAMKCTTVDTVRDAIAAGYGVTACGGMATHGQRDANGMLAPSPSGGHCQYFCGVFIDFKGRLVFVDQQSWGTNGPVGGGPWKLHDGREIQPREGACGVFADVVEKYLRTGEMWAIAPPVTPWGASDLKASDL